MIRSSFACLFLTSTVLGQVPVSRQVAAPPEDIRAGVVAMPDPSESATRSASRWIPIQFEGRGTRWVCEFEIERNGGETLTLVPFGARVHEWAFALRDDRGALRPIASQVVAGAVELLSTTMTDHFGDRHVDGYALAAAVTSAPTTGRISLPRRAGERAPQGGLLASGAGSLTLTTHLTTVRLCADEEIGVSAFLADPRGSDEGPVLGVVEDAWMTVDGPAGPFKLTMFDDGLHADGVAGDGRYGAFVPHGLSGDLQVVTHLRGREVDGTLIHLSGYLAFPVLEAAAVFSGRVGSRVEQDRAWAFDLGVHLLRDTDRLHVSGEVWVAASGEELAPAAWLSRIVELDSGVALDANVSLSLDGRWLGLRLGGTVPERVELRQLRLQDPATHVVFDVLERLPVEVGLLPANAFEEVPGVSREMLMGPSTIRPGPAAQEWSLFGALMLVHGYCSGGSVWPFTDFTGPIIEFSDPDQSRTHDEFAQLIQQTGSDEPSFGVVAHSQGGAAALHLYTFYQSGLDRARGARRIQSLGTPYQGTPLANFGFFACGTNFDLTPTGAAMWLAGIPTWAREEVYYWTTVDAGSACSFLANLVLEFNDNDGTTERVRGQLPGATNMGHIPGWCHTTGMTFPAGYLDTVLNADRDATAAR